MLIFRVLGGISVFVEECVGEISFARSYEELGNQRQSRGAASPGKIIIRKERRRDGLFPRGPVQGYR